MAHNRSYKPEDILFPDQVITESNLVDEMEKSYIEYAMSGFRPSRTSGSARPTMTDMAYSM